MVQADNLAVEVVELGNSQRSATFDVSNAGMTYWWLTGGPDGGNEFAGSDETRHLLQNPVPEPTTAAVLGLGASVLLLRRRRR